MTLGLILAGGRSRRFGAEKACARLAGMSLLEHAYLRLSPSCAETAVNAPPESQAAQLAARLGAVLLPDPADAPAGPLAGVLAGLLWARTRGEALLLTLPCDAPLVPPDLPARLAATIGSGAAAVASSPDGLQPLCALWRTCLIETIAAALAEGRHPAVHAVLEAAGAAEAAFPDAACFLNVNTLQDLAEAERRLGWRSR